MIRLVDLGLVGGFAVLHEYCSTHLAPDEARWKSRRGEGAGTSRIASHTIPQDISPILFLTQYLVCVYEHEHRYLLDIYGMSLTSEGL